MSLLTLGLWSGFLLIPSFILGPWVSSLTHLPLEPRFEDHSFLDQEIANFEQGLDSILTDSIEALRLDTSLDEPDSLLLQSLLGFSTWLVLFVILLNHTLFQVSCLIN